MAFVSASPDTIKSIYSQYGSDPNQLRFQLSLAQANADAASNQDQGYRLAGSPAYYSGNGYVESNVGLNPADYGGLATNVPSESGGSGVLTGPGGSVGGSIGAAGVSSGGAPGAGGAPVAPQLASFAPPDPNNFTKDPSYQFTLNQGVNALQNSAAARGTLLTGATAKGIQDYGQQSALQGYQQAYNNALQTYGTNTNTAQANFGNANTTFGQNLAARGQASQIGLAQNAQAQAAQAQSFNEGQTQYQNQVGAQQYNDSLANTTFEQNLAARGQASQIGLAQNAQAQAAQAQSFNEGQTQYQNQVGAQQYNNSLAMQANQTQYDRALQNGAPYNLASYALPGLPQTRTLASSAYA